MPPPHRDLPSALAAEPAVRPGAEPAAPDELHFEATLRGRSFAFTTTWGLFSPKGIDPGTRLLIDHLDIPPAADCLDLGCGYGPIGLVMAAHAPSGRVVMVDRDFVAVEYALSNAERNGLSNASAILSDGFRHLGDQRFDLVASNLPAKVGREMIERIIRDAHAHLNPGGRIYVVVISRLRPFIKRLFEATFGNSTKVKQGPTHTVMMAERRPTSTDPPRRHP